MTVLVIANPAAKHLALLDRLPGDVNVVVGELPSGRDADVVAIEGPRGAALRKLWPELTKVRWVHSFSAGLELLLFPEFVESDVVLTNGRGVFARSLGEFALAGMLHFAKDLRRMVRSQEAGVWEPYDVDELHGRTLAIAGYGEIGRQTAMRAKAFGMRVHALRRRPIEDALVDRMFTHAELREMLAGADYLLVSAPLTGETRGMIGAAELALLPAHAVVMNLGRGPVIVESALAEALKEKRIRGAVLDVFDEEPLPEGHVFYGLDNVLLSPHCADHTATWLEDAMELFLENFELYRAGKPLKNVVEKRSGY